MASSDRQLPNPTPRPEGELEALEKAWQPPRGFRLLTAVNNSYIGLYYVGIAVMFFIFAGILARLGHLRCPLPYHYLPEALVVSKRPAVCDDCGSCRRRLERSARSTWPIAASEALHHPACPRLSGSSLPHGNAATRSL